MNITISIPQIVITISNNQNLNLGKMAHTIDELIAEVSENKTLADGVKATISGLRQKVADAIASAGAGTSDAELAAIQAKVDSLFTDLAASNDEIAGALAENTTPADGGVTTPPVDATPAPATEPTPAPTDGNTTPPADVPPVTDVPAPTDTTVPPVDASVPPADATPAPSDAAATIPPADGVTVI